MRKTIRLFTIVMVCVAMVLCVSCKKDDDNEPGGGDTGGHECVDLGLPSGLLWATCNVGADKSEDYGDYFAWGEMMTKNKYDWSTYKWCNNDDYFNLYNLTKYCTNSNYGTVDYKTVLDPEDDAARVSWGGDWRMPTSTEFKELYDNTTCAGTTMNGVYGRKFTSETDCSKYIFLPASGYRYGTSLDVAGSDGFYWSSSLCSSDDDGGVIMYFYSGDVYPQYGNDRSCGCTVRPVCKPQN